MALLSAEGWLFLMRWFHFLAGITWIGLLYYFNLVQTPFFAETEAPVRSGAVQKLVPRALWWFRYGALLTLLTGLSIIVAQQDIGDYFDSSRGVAISTGILLALVMFINVWAIIWRNQKIVIANARNVQAGGEADPAAAPAARKAGLASRMNTIFSFPVLFLMVGAAHIFRNFEYFDVDPGGTGWVFFLICAAVIVVLEANALGYVSGTGTGGLNVIYETHRNALYTGLGLIVVFYILAEILLNA